jgi:hypothetical protein
VIFGPGWGIAIDAFTFLLSAAFLTRAQSATMTRPEVREEPSLVIQLREGWQEFRTRPWVWRVVLQFAIVNLCFRPAVIVLGVDLAKQHFDGPRGWSIVLTVNAVGLVAGGFVGMKVRPRFPLLSRVTSYDDLGSFVLSPLGLILVGPISDVIGVSRAVFAAGCFLFCATVLSFISPSVRNIPATRPNSRTISSSATQ